MVAIWLEHGWKTIGVPAITKMSEPTLPSIIIGFRDTRSFLCLDMFETILTHHRCRNIEVLSLCKFQQSVSPCASSISISWGIPCCWDRPLEQHTWWQSRKREIKLEPGSNHFTQKIWFKIKGIWKARAGLQIQGTSHITWWLPS